MSEAARRRTGPVSGYRPEFCKAVMDHCAEGYSLASFSTTIAVSPRTLRNWSSKYPEFKEAVGAALARRCLYWETTALEIIHHGRNRPVTDAEARVVFYMLKMLWRQTGEINSAASRAR